LRIHDDEARSAEAIGVDLDRLRARTAHRAQQAAAIEPRPAQHRLSAARAGRRHDDFVPAYRGLREIRDDDRKAELRRHLAPEGLAVRRRRAIHGSRTDGVHAGEALELHTRLVAGAEQSHVHRAVQGYFPRNDAARRAGAEICDEPPVHHGEERAIRKPVE